jgi:hypothetical protein
VQERGLGSEWVRAPRLPLIGAERKQILKIIHDGIDKRPKLPKRSTSSRLASDNDRQNGIALPDSRSPITRYRSPIVAS